MSIRHTPARLGAVALAAAFACAAATAAGAPISLAEALAGARANLDVAIAERGLAAAQADIAAADHAPLPQLTAKLSQIDLQHGIGPGNLLRDKRIDKDLGLDWTWERGDKRGLRSEGARRAAAAAASDRDETRTQQQMLAWAAYYDLLAAQGRIEQLAAIEASARQTAEIARKRLQAGDTALQDAARAEIEAERARADADAAQLDRRRAQGVLALLIGRDGDPGALEARVDWPATAAPTDAADAAARIDDRADVRAAQERVRAAEAALGGAQAQTKSDLTWGVSLDHDPGTSTRQVELRVSLPLTWGYRYEGEIGRAQAQLEQARDALEKARRGAAGEMQRLHAELAGTVQRAHRYEAEIVPRARDVAARAELAYAKGALSLTDLLDARRTLRAALLDALAARTDHAKALGAWRLRSGDAPAPD